MMYCPQCRNLSAITQNPTLQKVELFTEMPETDTFRCNNGHAFNDYLALMAMSPELVKLVPMEKPQANQVKAEFWIDQNVLDTFRNRYPNQQSSTVESILSMYLYGEVIIIDGNQAKQMKAFGIKNGAEVIASIELTRSLEGELQTAKETEKLLRSLIKGGDDA